MLIALRLGRYELERLPKSQSDVLLGYYYEYEIADIRNFNYRASEAKEHMEAAERDLAYMAVPYATSLYEAYLGEVAHLAVREGHGRVPVRAGAFKLHEYLGNAGVAVPTTEHTLFEAIRTIRNCVAHAAGIVDEEADAALAAVHANPDAAASWERVAKRKVPVLTPGEPLPLSGREAFVALYIVGNCAHWINHAAASAIGRDTWADVAILDYRREFTGRWHHLLTDVAMAKKWVDRRYGLVKLRESDLRAAIDRAPRTPRLP